ncbi:dihydropteroate synthase-like protein [Methanolacinia paynteri]|uniref:dihydropteroate synthase-like protein n=1 Tax=Methanolacinia paynteri TaxID=230356 RepID=UPI00064E95D5|nr:dihydropteroate synthase-like protein [Methanolacinia paynteri]
MRILLPTGEIAYPVVKKAAERFGADVAVAGKIAAFLAPKKLSGILSGSKVKYDMVIVSGMCTADFSGVEDEFGTPVYLGPRHAADLELILGHIDELELSRTIPADELIASKKKEEAYSKISETEERSQPDFYIGNLRIGGGSRMKVLAEIMDAHKTDNLRDIVFEFIESGADIIDLGFGFDATPEDVLRVFEEVSGIHTIFAADTQDPELIRAALGHADLILSLHDGNIPVVGKEVAEAGAAAVIVPNENTLEENIKMAGAAGIKRIVADPLLQPAGSGLLQSLSGFVPCGHPIFFGAGNVVELIDADSPGANALLAALAMEAGASIVFTSEHSDKTKGSVREMRRACEMMVLASNRPYPKDLGIDLFCIKEKRRRHELPLSYTTCNKAGGITDELVFDPAGNIRIGIEDGFIFAVHKGRAVKGKKWEEIFHMLLKEERVSLMDHAAYLGKELYKAELALKFNRSYEQDGPF